jgi:glycerophosphoryl diester phosphodiesterase
MASLPPLYAHRFGRDAGPDSSRITLRRTLAGGAEGLETDVCLTADRRLALLHDPWLRLGTTRIGWAHETDWSALRDARLLDRHGAVTGETPMLLDELWDVVPDGMPLQLEVKAHGSPDLAVATAAAICDALDAVPDRRGVEVISFHSAACELAAARGHVVRLVLWADVEPDAVIAWAARHGVAGVCVEAALLHERLIRRLRVGGLSVTTGTINEPELARLAADLGVDAITSDRPGVLRARERAERVAAVAA